MADQPIKRCAIYTRKSTEEGLDQAFNNLDAPALPISLASSMKRLTLNVLLSFAQFECEAIAEHVHDIFCRCRELGTVAKLRLDLQTHNIKTKV
jgi:hypothetical protein